MDSLAPMMMDDKPFYDMGDHELLDVWNTDLATVRTGNIFVQFNHEFETCNRLVNLLNLQQLS